MKCYTWNNDYFGMYNVFIVMSYKEVENLVKHFGTKNIVSTSFDGKKFYYLLDTNKKMVTPMMKIEIAFAGQYNGNPPYGEEIEDFKFDIREYDVKQFDGKLSYFATPDKLAIDYRKHFSV